MNDVMECCASEGPSLFLAFVVIAVVVGIGLAADNAKIRPWMQAVGGVLILVTVGSIAYDLIVLFAS